MAYGPDFTYSRFRGKDNVRDPYTLAPSGHGTFLLEADNIDIDDDGLLHRREGYLKRYSGSNVRSLWAFRGIRLFLEGDSLKRLNPDLSATTLLDGLDPNSLMQYQEVNGDIFLTNGSMIGVVSGGAFKQLDEPTQNFKRIMPPGQLIEHYHSRLYVARDNVVYASDVNDYHVYDERYGFRQFEDRVTLMRGVSTGMFIGTTQIVFYLGGADHSQMTLLPVTDEGAFEGTGIKSEGGFRSTDGTVVLWVGPSGVFLGSAEGKTKYLTSSFYWPGLDMARGSAILRDVKNYSQYLVTIRE